MRIFVIRARKGTVQADRVLAQVGSGEHFEIIAHTLANAFYFSNGMREDVEVYVILDSAPDFPRTLKFYANGGLSFAGFHEAAILEVIQKVLAQGMHIAKDEVKTIQPGVDIAGFGFDVLMKQLQEKYPVYLMEKKGEDIRQLTFKEDAVFVLSDHLPMPKNSLKVLERRGATNISLGRKMLFASQCVVIIHNELDRR